MSIQREEEKQLDSAGRFCARIAHSSSLLRWIATGRTEQRNSMFCFESCLSVHRLFKWLLFPHDHLIGLVFRSQLPLFSLPDHPSLPLRVSRVYLGSAEGRERNPGRAGKRFSFFSLSLFLSGCVPHEWQTVLLKEMGVSEAV